VLSLKVKATGFIPGTDFSTTIDGEIVVNNDTAAFEAMTASITIPYEAQRSRRKKQEFLCLLP
jgi:hypothetical protein